jgi:hypothetical protein
VINNRDRLRASNLMTYARRQGLDLAAVLDTYDMLLTEAAVNRVGLEALRAFRRSMDQWQAHEFARRIRKDAPISPAEMFDAIASYLDDYITMKEKEAT